MNHIVVNLQPDQGLVAVNDTDGLLMCYKDGDLNFYEVSDYVDLEAYWVDDDPGLYIVNFNRCDDEYDDIEHDLDLIPFMDFEVER